MISATLMRKNLLRQFLTKIKNLSLVKSTDFAVPAGFQWGLDEHCQGPFLR